MIDNDYSRLIETPPPAENVPHQRHSAECCRRRSARERRALLNRIRSLTVIVDCLSIVLDTLHSGDADAALGIAHLELGPYSDALLVLDFVRKAVLELARVALEESRSLRIEAASQAGHVETPDGNGVPPGVEA